LRRRALTGDALAHAALPGICLAFMATGERRLPVLLAGAFVSGVVGNATLAALRRYTRLKEDAALGSVLTIFFGAGVVLSRVIQNSYPSANKAGLESFLLGKTAGMTRGDLYWIAALAAGCLITIILCYKEFKLTAFDGDFASTLGWPVYRLDMLMMALVAVAVVIGLPAVGVVMIAALLILPGTAARFWTEQLSIMLILAGTFGFGIGLVGTLASTYLALLPAGPIIVLTGTVLFLFSLLCGTKRGLVARWLLNRNFQQEWEGRQLLNVVFERREKLRPDIKPSDGWSFKFDDIRARKSWSSHKASGVVQRGIAEGLIQPLGQQQYKLTDFGQRRAVEVARGMRLWELFLKENPDLAGSLVNLAEESVTNVLPPETVKDLTQKLQAERRWPE
jgi:manganese/zinc/iron transport system permease protein